MFFLKKKRKGKRRIANLGENVRGGVVKMVIGNDDPLRHDDDVVMDFLGEALSPGHRHIHPYGLTPPRKTQQNYQQLRHQGNAAHHYYSYAEIQIPSASICSPIDLEARIRSCNLILVWFWLFSNCAISDYGPSNFYFWLLIGFLDGLNQQFI